VCVRACMRACVRACVCARVCVCVWGGYSSRVGTHLADVVVTLLHTQTCKPKRRLTTSSVLLRQVHTELVQHLTCVARQGPKQAPIAVHHLEVCVCMRVCKCVCVRVCVCVCVCVSE
jgi:hypothetical protein